MTHIPKKIQELVRSFKRHKAEYKKSAYNETEVRIEFVNPFWGELGWDVENKSGYAMPYREVIHEDAVKMGGTTKAPDYGFRIGGARKFFVETKKPSLNLKDDPSPANQLRRYAWNCKLPLSILMDFEEFAVYDCRVRPKPNDKASTARIMYITYEEYADVWEEIDTIFSRESILKGSFDKFAESRKTKGTAEVDDEFLDDMESWRETLAKNIALRNKMLSVRELNHAVQMTIDRIIFLRMCEDRGIENFQQLRELTSGKNIYAKLFEVFCYADQKYNSGLFHFEAEKGRSSQIDTLTAHLTIDDNVLKDILLQMYYPLSPYEFSILPPEILGSVYERFLGKAITLTKSHRAKVQYKPEVRKAGGVYYTPPYIVDYIVKNTVGRLCERKTPKQVENLKILDPACGSGSFLLGAYKCLLDWHLKYYIGEMENLGSNSSKTLPIYEGRGGQWLLTTKEKKRILLNNVYGVDIDPQAVEVTKLSLLLKILEDESKESLQSQFIFQRERALPDLSKNIKCGNSLIKSDFYTSNLLVMLDEEEQLRINVFDWEVEFPQIVKRGGFDAVIGNPPWVSLSGKFKNELCSDLELAYLKDVHQGNSYMPNMYEYFVEQGLNLACTNGYFSFIVPDRLGFNKQFLQLRKRILENSEILKLVYKAPFPKIIADTLIFVFQKGKPKSNHHVDVSEFGHPEIKRPQSDYLKHPACKFEYSESVSAMNLVQRIDDLTSVLRLGEIFFSTSGFGGKSKLICDKQSSQNQMIILKGKSINRYSIGQGFWFEFKAENLTGRTRDKTKLGSIPKILLRKTGKQIIATYDDTGIFPEQSLYFLYDNKTQIDFKYFVGILNSQLLSFYYRAKSITNKNSTPQLKNSDLDEFPLRVIDFGKSSDVEKYNRMVSFVELMLDLNKRFSKVRTPQEKVIVERQIAATDREVDELVYELYELTEEEILIVESDGVG